MTPYLLTKHLLYWVTFAIALAMTTGLSHASSPDIVVIYSKTLTNEHLSQQLLQRIYSMQKAVWSDGTPVRAFILPKSARAHNDFVRQFLHMHPYRLERYWNRLIFSGTGNEPRSVDSTEEMLRLVATTPGAIGYLDKSLLGATSLKAVGVFN